MNWIRGVQDYSLTFVGGAWASTERTNRKHDNSHAEASSVFAHVNASMSTFTRVLVDETGALSFTVDAGAMRGSWQPSAVGFETTCKTPVQAAFDASGSGFVAWSEDTRGARIDVSRYDGSGLVWDDTATEIPGSRQPTTKEAHRRGTPGIAIAPGGDAMVAWVEELGTRRWLKSSRYTLNVGWQSQPATVFSDPSLDPFSDPPALVYDGQTFVVAWTAQSEGSYVAYTARYDLTTGKWSRQPAHATPLGQSALVMPRLGTDARGNLLLLWALAKNPTQLAYRRYRAAAQEWTDIELVPDVALSDPTSETIGVLPFALSASGAGGLLFKSKSGSTETLKLAQFF